MKKFLFFLFLPISLISQNSLLVPSQYSTIQSAINISQNGDVILLSPGIYYEDLIITDKVNISIRSLFSTTLDSSYIYSTIISGSSSERIFTIESSELTMIGFTVTDGYSSAQGGAFYIGDDNNDYPSNVFLDH